MSRKSGPADAAIAFSYELKALVPALNAALAELFHPLGLSCVQADALMALEEVQPVTLSALGPHLVAESGHPSRLISRLEAMGLVQREVAPHDGRASLLSLTPAGAEKAAAARSARAPLAHALGQRYALEPLTTALRELRTDITEQRIARVGGRP
jgi:MarR family transcriptional regulator, organic hydroperoxide resistance regulator